MSHHSRAFCAEQLLQILQSLPAVNAYVVGFSGGADSTALLHALGSIREQLQRPVSAVHIHHGLHPDADQWQRQCEDFCQQHEISLVCLKVNPENGSGKGLEAEARHLRYAAISTLLSAGDCLLTAHHADDQAETLLLNLMRGSGVDGLAAMPESRPLGEAVLQRPLLGFQGGALRDYLHEHGVEWAEDPSNQSRDHDRNFVRHEVIPLLESRWPQVSKRLLLSRKAMTDTRQLLEKLADDYLTTHLKHPLVLDITGLTRETPELLKLVTRRWARQAGATAIPVYQLESFSEQLRHAHDGSRVAVRWDNCWIRLYRHQLWLQTAIEPPRCDHLQWPDGCAELVLGDGVGLLEFAYSGKQESPPDPPLASPVPGGGFFIGSREHFKAKTLAAGAHHKSLKNLFQSAGIPPWLRDSIPLCKHDGELVALGDWCFSEPFERWMADHDVRLTWRPQHPLLQHIRMQQGTANPDMVDPAGAVR